MSTTKILDPAKLRGNPFVGRTHLEPRPTWDPGKDGPFGPNGQEKLRADQAAWDFAKAWADQNAAMHQTRVDDLAAEKEAARQTDAAKAAERQVVEIKRRYFAADPLATEDAFKKELPDILSKIRTDAAANTSHDVATWERSHAIDRAVYQI